jgi:hypothetical protein
MIKFFMILVMFFLFFSLNKNLNADEIIDNNTKTITKIKNESKDILKTLISKSLKEDEILIFLYNYVITFDDERGDGVVTYYFEDNTYKRYKDLVLLSEDTWKISKIDRKLKIFYNKKKNTWKIKPGKKNVISIKKKLTSIGSTHEFSYENKTDYHIKLEEKKL